MLKKLPGPGRLDAEIVPPCFSINSLHRISPVPVSLLVPGLVVCGSLEFFSLLISPPEKAKRRQ